MAPWRRPDAHTWLQAFLLLAIGWFYFWTAVPEWRPRLIAPSNPSYYNLLTRGFLQGHLYLDLPVDPFLRTLQNPSDPAQRAGHGPHDASYYHGRYYIYFGVTPAVLAFLPFRLLTGNFVDDSLVVPLFACAGLVMAVLLLRAVRARYFPQASLAAGAACVLALGLTNLVPMLLRRTSVWEVPIACGYFCCMAALYALFRAWHSSRRAAWLAVASAAFGFAVGSRPTYLPAAAALLLALAAFLREERGVADFARRRRLVLAAGLPIAAIGAGLALYNCLRFGNPFDFGWRHMLNADPVATAQVLGRRFLGFNLRVYALAAAQWGPYFPYVGLARLPASPTGMMAVEDPYGLLPNIPFVLLGLAAFGRAGAQRAAARPRLVLFTACVLVAAAGPGLLTASFCASTNRYMVDFVPAFVVLACLGLLAVAGPGSHRGAAWLGRGLIGGLLAFSAVFNVLVSFRHNELFRAEHPALYRRVAYAGNFPSDLVDLLAHRTYGPVELKVIFPEDRPGTVEPLVVTGSQFLSDYLYVHYLGPGLVRFGFDHTSRASFVGQPVAIKPGQVQVLRIDLGSLYPPAAHPYFDAMTPAEASRRQETLRVTCNGQVVLDRRTQFYDASAWRPSIGSAAGRPGFSTPFSGRIVSRQRLSEVALGSSLGELTGPVRLEAILPPFIGPRSEPLLSTGVFGHGDLVYVHYDRVGEISFGYDHWGAGGKITAPMAVDPLARQVIEIDSGALHSGGIAPETQPEINGRHLTIRLNGWTVFDEAAPVWPCDPSTVAAAVNVIEASTAGPFFSGEVIRMERLAQP